MSSNSKAHVCQDSVFKGLHVKDAKGEVFNKQFEVECFAALWRWMMSGRSLADQVRFLHDCTGS